ncbi:Excitatory amino acid transporter 2 [Strongyloides ratti]|uniref:Amino acid transporter n=1 Tax=Strongyloides ratti TaxID=34506 RepID=A0A090KVL4_STRRB|nr:Excitatory amino acid transporter 2 [Strongyloides ratti]CEF59272.1 Excitatory amino acid transporter 2 [Strongyloides ratti]
MTNKKDLLLVLTIESVVIGVVLGFIIRPFNPSNDLIQLIGFPGEIFMQIVEMMILPLIISSVISALSQIAFKDATKIGLITVFYYMTTTFLSTVIGILIVSSIHPGDPTLIHSFGEGTLDDTELSPLDTFLDQIRNMFPENIIQATFQQVQTEYIEVKTRIHKVSGVNETEVSNFTEPVVMKPTLKYTNEMNVLGLIVFCSGFGVILSILGEQARLMINFFVVLDAIIMRWISALMWCYPIGILSLVCKNIVDIDNLTETAQALAMYVVTVICGLMIHSLLTLPLLYFLVTRESPFAFMTGMLQAIATAFGTASSGATLPVTFRSMEDNLKIDRRITRFVLPLGATITMDGTALYEAVAVIFIAQLHAIKLSVFDLLTISITTTVASIGSGSVPAGLDTIKIVLTTVGLPSRDIGLLMTVDWLLDRIRTSVNVLGDGFGAGIIHHMVKDNLQQSDEDILCKQIKSNPSLLDDVPSQIITIPNNNTPSVMEPQQEIKEQNLENKNNRKEGNTNTHQPLGHRISRSASDYIFKNNTDHLKEHSKNEQEKLALLVGNKEFTV